MKIAHIIPLAALFVFLGAAPLTAQSAKPVAAFDLNRFLGVWYEQARLPTKPERKCASDGLVLYSLADKPARFQLVTSCIWKTGNSDSSNKDGRLSPAHDGRLRLQFIWPYWRLWPFSRKYWVLALGPETVIDNSPEYEWAIVGTPNHKTLWLLTRAARPGAALLAELRSRAAQQGFNTAKLIAVPQRREVVATSQKVEQPQNPPPPTASAPLKNTPAPAALTPRETPQPTPQEAPPTSPQTSPQQTTPATPRSNPTQAPPE